MGGAKQSWKFPASTATCTAASTITATTYLGSTCAPLQKLATVATNMKAGKCFAVSLGTQKFWGKLECGKGTLSGTKVEICKVPTGAKKAQCVAQASSASLSASFGLLSLAA